MRLWLLAISFYILILVTYNKALHFNQEYFTTETPLEFCDIMTTPNATRLPAVFVSHGGGPSFFLEGNGGMMSDIDMNSEAKRSLERLPKQLHAERPSAIVVVTAHWEGEQVLVAGKDDYSSLYYDYGGFPAHTYQLKYLAPAETKLADRIVQMLTNNGVAAKLDKKRNWDHGVFIPLMVMYPKADIPVVAVSILQSYNPSEHIALGKALAPLRDENILIVGSGFATHNFRAHAADNLKFVNAVTAALANPSQGEREKAFINWTALPGARQAHAQEDHLMPLHVVVGAAGEDGGKEMFRQAVSGGSFFIHWGFGV